MKHGGGSIIWGAITRNGVGSLVKMVCDGNEKGGLPQNTAG